MKICKLAIHHLQIPLKFQFAQANHSAKHSNSILVELETERGILGFGESCPRTYVTAECPNSVSKDLKKIQNLLWQKEFIDIEDIESFICDNLACRIRPAALCALELAILDGWSKTYKEPLIKALGGQVREEFRYTGVLPTSNLEKIIPFLNQFSFPQIKIKMGRDLNENLLRINSLKAIYGPRIGIQADLNTCWTWQDALEQIPVLMKQGVKIFEQPFLPTNDACMGKLQDYFGVEACFMADESATTPRQVQSLLVNKQCNRINLKISKHGGIFQTLRIYREAWKQGIDCQLGAHFGETSILTYAGLIVACCVPKLTGLEGAFGTYLLETDLCDPSLRFDQQACIKEPSYHKLGMISGFSWDRIKSHVQPANISENPYCLK